MANANAFAKAMTLEKRNSMEGITMDNLQTEKPLLDRNFAGSISDELFRRAKQVAPGGVHSPVRSFKGMDRAPLFFKSAKGCTLTSVEGKDYTDYCMSFGPLILGHRDPDVTEAVHKMIDTAWSFGACEPYSLELAEWMMTELTWVDKVRFVSSGTEAVMSAMRVARAATGRSKVLKFEGCYHGHVDALLVQAGSGLAGESAASSAGIPEEIAALTLVSPLDDEAQLEQIFAKHGSEIAALMIEPLPANYGLLEQRIDFLKTCERLCKKHGTLLVFDEVISGFRVGLQGMVGITDIIPDLVCYGKIIGGGFPVGCYAGKRYLMDLVAPIGNVYQAGTLSANPVGMRAGLVTLKKMKEENLWQKVNQSTKNFANYLQNQFDANDISMNVAYHSSLFWIHQKTGSVIRTTQGLPKNQAANFKSLFLSCLDKGIYLAPNAYEVGFVSAAHTEEVLRSTADKILEASLAK